MGIFRCIPHGFQQACLSYTPLYHAGLSLEERLGNHEGRYFHDLAFESSAQYAILIG